MASHLHASVFGALTGRRHHLVGGTAIKRGAWDSPLPAFLRLSLTTTEERLEAAPHLVNLLPGHCGGECGAAQALQGELQTGEQAHQGQGHLLSRRVPTAAATARRAAALAARPLGRRPRGGAADKRAHVPKIERGRQVPRAEKSFM